MAASHPLSIRKRMHLRPNPDSFMHSLLPNNWVQHSDLFAYIRKDTPSRVLFRLELRHGGRGDVTAHHAMATIGEPALPRLVPPGQWRHYSETDVTRLTGPAYPWACYVHHAFLKRWGAKLALPGCRHVSFMAHYLPNREHDPSRGFVNWSHREGKGTIISLKEIRDFASPNLDIVHIA
jgi:hypothetical protein